MEKNLVLQLQSSSTAKGIEVLAITAGIGNGWDFSPAVLEASLSLWEGAECYADHTTDKHSVRDLGGILNNPVWDMAASGIRATLTPTGPAAPVFVELAHAAIDHPDLQVGLSADILMQVDGKKVIKIVKVKSLDAVTWPARGGKFVRVLQSKGEGMSEEIEEKDDDQKEEKVVVNNQVQLQEQVQSADKALAATCGYLLTAALQASKLPEVVKTRLQKEYAGKVFEPAVLQASIEEARLEVSTLTAGGIVQGPGRVSGMVTGEDQLKAAVFDLFGEERDPELKNVKAARLTGLRELYMGCTADYDLHGGADPVHALFQLSTSTFTILVKNALNKAMCRHWDAFGKAGYDWWKPIVTVEHFNTVNDITNCRSIGISRMDSLFMNNQAVSRGSQTSDGKTVGIECGICYNKGIAKSNQQSFVALAISDQLASRNIVWNRSW